MFFFKQKTAYELRISDWSSDVCSSDLFEATKLGRGEAAAAEAAETARQTFEEGVTATGLPTIEVSESELSAGLPAFELLRRAGLAKSNGEARRLIKGGGARINDVAIADELQTVGLDDLDPEGCIKLSAGKKRHALVKLAA